MILPHEQGRTAWALKQKNPQLLYNETGSALADFAPDPNAKQRAEAEATGHHHGPKKSVGSPAPDDGNRVVASDEGGEVVQGDGKADREDEGTVVGAMISGNQVHVEQVSSAGGVKAVPAVDRVDGVLWLHDRRHGGAGTEYSFNLGDIMIVRGGRAIYGESVGILVLDNGTKVPPHHLRLRLNTLGESHYWIDSGSVFVS